MHTSKERVITIGGTDVVIGIPWVLDDFDNALKMSFNLRRKAKAAKLRFGAKASDFKDGYKYSQYFLTDREDAFKSKAVIGSLFVADTIRKMTPQDCSTIFVYNISEDLDDDLTSNNTYWATAVDERGHVLAGDDAIINSDEELTDFIFNYRSISQKVQIVILEDDTMSFTVIKSFIQDDDDVATLQKVANERFNVYLAESEFHLSVMYRESPLALKKAMLAIGGAAVLGGVVFGYQYYTSTPSVDYFMSDSRNAVVTDIRTTASAALKGYQSSKTWNDTTFATDVIKEFNDFYLNNKMTPTDIGNVMFSIERSMPLYAMGWVMEEINMSEGQFYVTYKRDQESRGTFVILDGYLSSLAKNIADYSLAPIGENNDFDTRVYKVTPLIKVGLTGKAETFAQQRRRVNAYNTQREALLEDIKKTGDQWIKANAKFNSMGLMGRLFFEDTTGLMRSSVKHEEKLLKLQAELEEIESKGIRSLSESIDESWVSGNWNDYIVLMQTDNLFNWSVPTYGLSFPSEEQIEAKGKKANDRKKGDEPKYSTAIQSYSVKISTNEGDDGNNVRTYGILDFKQLMEILSQPSIQVVGVQYFKESEQWSVDIRFYAKTDTFEHFLM